MLTKVFFVAIKGKENQPQMSHFYNGPLALFMTIVSVFFADFGLKKVLKALVMNMMWW